MMKFLSLLCCCLATVIPAVAGLNLENPGFENGLNGWVVLEKDLPAPMSEATAEAVREGAMGLRVDDKDRQYGSSLVSQPVPVEPGKSYRVSFFARGASNKAAVYMRFQDSSRKVMNPNSMPTAAVNQPGSDWHSYSVTAVAPDGAATLAIWVHSWSGAVGVIDFDDFTVEEVAGSAAAAAPSSAPAAAETPASLSAPTSAPAKTAPPQVASKREKPAMIVIKLDDLRVGNSGRQPAAWQRVLDILKARQIKGSFGIICDSLAKGRPEYIQWIKETQASGLIEFWFHGLNHDVRQENGTDMAEFVGRPYEEQKRRFEESIKMAEDKLGFPLHTFGPPGGGKVGSFDEATFRVMTDVPAMKVWLYPQPLDEPGRQLAAAGKVTILDRVWPVNIEQPLFTPNSAALIRGYGRYPQRDYFVLQGHPAHWKEEGFAEFEKILDFLQQQGAVFVTPSECATAVSSTKQTAQSQ